MNEDEIPYFLSSPTQQIAGIILFIFILIFMILSTFAAFQDHTLFIVPPMHIPFLIMVYFCSLRTKKFGIIGNRFIIRSYSEECIIDKRNLTDVYSNGFCRSIVVEFDHETRFGTKIAFHPEKNTISRSQLTRR